MSNPVLWRQAVLDALHRHAERHGSPVITRQALIREELPRIVEATSSEGRTPEQTLSRVLQELREEGVVAFGEAAGVYALTETPLAIETEELPDDLLEDVIRSNKLLLGTVETGETTAQQRRRKGQDKVREMTLRNYGERCSLCDVAEKSFLVASHIAAWADCAEGRGDLRNVACMCRLHDQLFDCGWFSLADDYRLIRRPRVESRMIDVVLDATQDFRAPREFAPSADFLRRHRAKWGSPYSARAGDLAS